MPWLVLETLQDIIDQTGDAANQASVAERSGLTKKVVSFWMIALSEEGLVDRGPDIDGRAHRVILTKYGTETLLRCRAQLCEGGTRSMGLPRHG